MIKKSILRSYKAIIIILLWNIFTGLSIAKNFDDSVITHIDYPKWFKKSPFIELSEDLNEARQKGKKGLMLFFTTEGCSYCDRFIRLSLADPTISSLIQKNFVSVGMEIFNDAEITSPDGRSMSAKKFAKSEGVQFSPSVIFYGEKGKKIIRLVGYQSAERFTKILKYIEGDFYKSETLSHYLVRQSVLDTPVKVMAGLKPDPLFSKPPYILEGGYRSTKKPMLVIFEKKSCSECELFHKSVLSLKEVRGMMKQFDIVRLDIADNKTPILLPNGKRITPMLWYKQAAFTRVPSMLLFSDKGEEVLKTDALVMRLRMVNSLKYVTERAYEKGWTFQRFGREKGRAKARKERLKLGMADEAL